ncbi:MAG TPA: GFA family protein [Allosphingosinicella sp.]|nr:GFA family protein [Allosphingosinicella sp.]
MTGMIIPDSGIDIDSARIGKRPTPGRRGSADEGSDACRQMLVRRRCLVPDAFLYAACCHCSNCRRTTGSAFKPFAGIEREKLVLAEGHGCLLIFGDDQELPPAPGV